MRVKFGDIVKDVKENVDRSNNPYKFYVAGDHMDSEDFRIHRFGRFATDDVGPAFVRIFHPGQILYGSRRTYLKKVCVADFEGITANTTFVLETKDETVLMQKLLPFLMLSKGFTDWSIKHSKGSTNPYVLFSDLASYEFDLPPLERQQELAELLWAANDLKESYMKMIVATDELLKAKFREMFVSAKAWPTKPLKEISQYYNGLTYKPGDVSDSGVVVLRSSNIQDGALAFDDIVRVNTDIKEKLWVKDGDILMCSRNGSAALVGKVALIQGLKEEMTFGAFMMIIRSQYSEYLFQYFQSKAFKDQIKGSQSSVMNQITGRMLDAVVVPLPPLALQQQFVEIARKADETKAALKKSIADVGQVIKGIING